MAIFSELSGLTTLNFDYGDSHAYPQAVRDKMQKGCESKAECKIEEDKPLTLDEAIAHAEERIDDTPCGRQHKQLEGWMKEVREMKNSPAGNAAAMREALLRVLRLANVTDDGAGRGWNEDVAAMVADIARTAISKAARNCDLFGGDKDNLHDKWLEWSRTKEGHNSDGTVKLTFGEWLLEEADKER